MLTVPIFLAEVCASKRVRNMPRLMPDRPASPQESVNVQTMSSVILRTNAANQVWKGEYFNHLAE